MTMCLYTEYRSIPSTHQRKYLTAIHLPVRLNLPVHICIIGCLYNELRSIPFKPTYRSEKIHNF